MCFFFSFTNSTCIIFVIPTTLRRSVKHLCTVFSDQIYVETICCLLSYSTPWELHRPCLELSFDYQEKHSSLLGSNTYNMLVSHFIWQDYYCLISDLKDVDICAWPCWRLEKRQYGIFLYVVHVPWAFPCSIVYWSSSIMNFHVALLPTDSGSLRI